MRPEVLQTLRSLRLHRKYSATLLEKRPDVVGMLRKAKDMITWGEISAEGLGLLLRRRARLEGNERIADEWVRKRFKYTSIEELAGAVARGDLPLDRLWRRGIKPFFRLHPPKGGFRYSTKHPVAGLGELGYRGDQISELVGRMA